jgi:hypothetical protein
VGVRERGAAVALAALPRLQLELTPSPSTPFVASVRPAGAIKAEEAPPEPGGRVGDRNYRDADEPHSGGRDQKTRLL